MWILLEACSANQPLVVFHSGQEAVSRRGDCGLAARHHLAVYVRENYRQVCGENCADIIRGVLLHDHGHSFCRSRQSCRCSNSRKRGTPRAVSRRNSRRCASDSGAGGFAISGTSVPCQFTGARVFLDNIGDWDGRDNNAAVGITLQMGCWRCQAKWFTCPNLVKMNRQYSQKSGRQHRSLYASGTPKSKQPCCSSSVEKYPGGARGGSAPSLRSWRASAAKSLRRCWLLSPRSSLHGSHPAPAPRYAAPCG